MTLSACETALGREAGGEGFVGFTQALLMSGARSVCLSLWKVDDTATALLMQRFYANLLGVRPGFSQPYAQGGGPGRGEGVAARFESRGSDGAGGKADGRRGAGRGGKAAATGSADTGCAGRGERRPALCPPLLLGRIRPGR